MLSALKDKEMSAGELTDVCSYALGSSLKRELENLVAVGLATKANEAIFTPRKASTKTVPWWKRILK